MVLHVLGFVNLPLCNSLQLSQLIIRSYCQKSPPGSRYVKPLAGIRKYLVEKCFGFVKGYEHILATKFPRAFRIYQVFSIGTKDLYKDIKEYMRISSDLRYGKSVRNLQRKELENYFQTPKDMIKVGPVLLFAALPFANYVILPLVFLFPHRLLSPHFWSLQERIEFAVRQQRKKLHNYRPVFRHLQAKVATIDDDEMRDKCFSILYKIGSGIHPLVEDILEVKPLFVDKPYGLSMLSSNHMRGLCRMHGLSSIPGKRYRLWTHAGFVREMDLAIHREGVQSMNLDELRWACFLRGLSPLGLHKNEMINWLTQWITVARNVDSTSLSLLLHSPILLAYNYSSNWVLIH